MQPIHDTTITYGLLIILERVVALLRDPIVGLMP
jgi:hypothetical protein